MNRIFSGGAIALLAAVASAQEFKLGSTVTDFPLQAVTGAPSSYAALKGGITVVAFISVQCPISNDYNERMESLYRDYSAKGVKFIFVNANASEPAAEVAAHAKSAGFSFPVYKDAGNVAADKFGAQVTPETFVMNAAGVVLYHGAIDDARNPARVTAKGLRNALDAVLAGKPVPQAETKAFGCTIKRVRRSS
ncbi:MAG: redoxin domain-containing protein [Acidobacteria bacterium]|nr:redoxin domain-containing protein [Acidobacteriota bacterium]